MNPSRTRHALFGLFLVATLTLPGCAGVATHREGRALINEGRVEEGLAKLQQATKEAPDSLEFRVDYLNSRESAVNRLMTSAQREHSAGRFDEAEALFNKALALDPSHAPAKAGIAGIAQARRHAKLIAEANALVVANDPDGAERKLAAILLESPQHLEARALRRQIEERGGRFQVVSPILRKTFRKPVNLEFRDTNLKFVLEALSRHSGLNFMLDKDVPANLNITVFLREVAVEDALDVILATHQLDKRVLNDTTLLIYPNTAAKQVEHQELVVKSFYLSNANAKQVMEMLRAVIKAKNLYVDEKLNLLIMRDTPTAIRVAERLVALQDISEPEVMLEVEVIEVQRSRLQQLGIQFPDQLTLAPLATGTTLTLQDLQKLNSSRVGATISNTVINLHKDIGETNILANPRIRTRNREKAEIRIGDRVPVITTTSTATGFVSESVQYVDVGLKVNVEPIIYPDNEISIKIGLEVSSVVKEVTSKAGSLSYQIGSRNASTVLRLKDGETQVLGGLINDQDRTTANRVPGLGDLPVLGRLFSSQKDDTQKTELVLSITPRLIRGIGPPQNMPTEFWTGSESNLRLKPLAPTPVGTTAKAPDKTAPAAAAAGSPAAAQVTAVAATETLAGSAPAQQKAPMLKWAGTPSAKVGATFSLTVKLSDGAATTGFPLQIKYDPAVLEVVDATPGGYMAQTGGKADFAKRIVAGSGMAFITQNRTGEPAKGDGDLLNIQFKALKPATGSIVTLLPATPVGPSNVPMQSTGPAMIGVTVTP